MSMSPSTVDALPTDTPQPDAWPLLPVETDIYILPDGRVIIADLPGELATRLAQLGLVEPCEITDHDGTDSLA
ncbi:MAG TPA: hypothetical protein GX400_23785 [Chloroflexi bacterium]|nr:hypothetical protein [Chloroflexota bacterium]